MPNKLKWLNVEFVSRCNLRCKWCALDHGKPAVQLDESLFSRLLDEACDPERWWIEEIALFNGGEVLLHPGLRSMLDIVADRRRRVERMPTVTLLTNGVLLDEERASILLESGALDLVRFSVDGGTPRDFEEIRRGARWDRVSTQIRSFVAKNRGAARRVQTGIFCTIPPERPLNIGWMAPEFVEVLTSVDQYELRYPHNWDGSAELDVNRAYWERYAIGKQGLPCKFLANNLVVLPDGRVTVCCSDLNARGVVGSLVDRSLTEVYQSAERIKMIRAFLRGAKDAIPLCQSCTGYY